MNQTDTPSTLMPNQEAFPPEAEEENVMYAIGVELSRLDVPFSTLQHVLSGRREALANAYRSGYQAENVRKLKIDGGG